MDRSWSLLSVALLFAVPAPTAAAPASPVPPLGAEPDYLFPPADFAKRTAAVQILRAPVFGGGELVSYRAFDGTFYTLTRFRGRHVAVLLPDSWRGEGKLTSELIRTFLDRSDLLYESFRELIGREPGPADSLLNIAVVRTCGYGCGWVGAKGVEIANDSGALALVKPQLEAGLAPDVLAHELGHNFDLFNSRLGFWPDFAHAWTRFFDQYVLVYDREGKRAEGPDEILRRVARETFVAYMANPSLTWESCVRDGLCSSRNDAWAGTLWRLAQLHGAGAIRGYTRFLGEHAASQPAPTTPEEKNDLHVEAMAAGAGLDLGCYVDAWRWHASPALRARMASDHGPGNAFCDDLDGDGHSRLAGDCGEDDDAARHPGAAELADGLDDDCDEIADDLLAAEDGDFPHLQPVSYPARVRGAISTSSDSDRFTVDLPGPRRMRVDLCSRPDFQGWAFVYQQDGNWLSYQFASQGTCTSHVYELDGAGTWQWSVDLNVNSHPGGYEVTLYDAAPRPAPPWAATGVRQLCSGAYALTAAAAAVDAMPVPPNEVRFWVAGVGVIGTVPYAPFAALRWSPPAGVDGTHDFRAQLLAGGLPVSDVTPPTPLVSAGPCETATVTASPVSGLMTGEAGGSASFTVALTALPTADVTVALSASHPGEGTVSPAVLTFTPTDWEVPRVITVTGVDDAVPDGDTSYTIVTGPAASGDPAYDGFDPPDVAVTNADDDAKGRFYTLPPCRLLDTRTPADGPALASEVVRTAVLRGRCGVPPEAWALAVNVTVLLADGAGHLTLYPAGGPAPATSSLNFLPRQTRANNAILPLAVDGSLALRPVVAGGGSVHVIVDVSGYFD